MATVPGALHQSKEPPKRRACDECRTRKLACTKEAAGCARCKREGIQCVYSTQKPMGRPRKRPQAEVSGHDGEPVVASSGDLMDVDLSFLDADVAGMDFLDILSSVDVPSHEAPHDETRKTSPQYQNVTSGMWHDYLKGVDFNALGDSSPEANQSSDSSSTAVSPESLVQDGTREAEQNPGRPSVSADALGNGLGFINAPNKVCGCLASLYLAMDSLALLPDQVGPAMGIARNATRTAHNAILCPVCSPEITDTSITPPVQSYQNLMMLGALLPTIANTYNVVLGMIDAEAEKAQAEGRQLTFTLDQYGGLWGRMAAMDSLCGATDSVNGAVLDPAFWRHTVRALLKIDIYGAKSQEESRQKAWASCVQIGLKDILQMMETRAQARHDFLDNAIRLGEFKLPHGSCYKPLPPGVKHPCQQIINIAKQAFDQLVVP